MKSRRDSGGSVRHLAVSAAMVLVLALLAVSCSRSGGDAGRLRGAGAPVPVLATQAEARDVPVQISAIGSVQAYSMVAIRPQITGPIQEVHFQEGQEVKAGDLLFTLDPRPWRAVLNQVEANLKRDEAQMVNARMEFLRTSNLFQSKIASQQDYDAAEASYEALQATVIADQAAYTNAEVTLGYTTIRSPIDGRAGNLTLKKGNIVKAPDDILLTITQVRPVYVAFSVPEQNLTAIRRESGVRSLSVQAWFPGQTNEMAEGVLTFVNNTVDTNTGTILLKATFENRNETLWPGQFVETALTLSNVSQAIVVPSEAIQSGQNGEFVFVVNSSQTAEMRPVATGITSEGMTVVTRGVSAGEVVVTDGQLRLTPGAKVSVKNSAAPGPATNAPADQGTRVSGRPKSEV